MPRLLSTSTPTPSHTHRRPTRTRHTDSTCNVHEGYGVRAGRWRHMRRAHTTVHSAHTQRDAAHGRNRTQTADPRIMPHTHTHTAPATARQQARNVPRGTTRMPAPPPCHAYIPVTHAAAAWSVEWVMTATTAHSNNTAAGSREARTMVSASGMDRGQRFTTAPQPTAAAPRLPCCQWMLHAQPHTACPGPCRCGATPPLQCQTSTPRCVLHLQVRDFLFYNLPAGAGCFGQNCNPGASPVRPTW